jgi:clan AA aspartic protease
VLPYEVRASSVFEGKEMAMGLTTLEIEVGNPANPQGTEKVEFLIDSGAIYSVVPTPILERLGIQPLTAQEFRLADGTKITRKKGIALFKFGDRIGGADVIFGEEGDSVLLGAFTLEALGLSLDPLRRELKPLPMILASVVGEL